MLLKLPYEITLNIISHLEFKDKVNLKTTCHKVSDLITHAVLYEDLDLLHPKYRTEYIPDNRLYWDPPNYTYDTIKKLVNEQFDGSCIRVLHIYTMDLSDHELSQLSDLFPNITRIITTNKTRREGFLQYDYPRIFESGTNPLVKWRDTIQKIDSRYDWKEVLNDVLCSKYPRLTELDLIGDCGILARCMTDHNLSFFSNAPLLTTLTLRYINVELDILEAIHAGFPLLQSLRLFKAHIDKKDNAALLPSIVPANNMTCLELSQSSYFNTSKAILYYILKKYPHLEQLHFGVFKEDHSLLCRSNESRFFSNLPRSLKTLTLEVYNMANAVTGLSESNAKIATLNLLDYKRKYDKEWKLPNIFKPLKKITSLRTLKIKLSSSVQKLTPEFISFTVTRLFITLSGGSFAIEWVLSLFPNLEELDITPSKYMTDDVFDYVIGGQRNDNNGDGEEMRLRKEYPNLRILNTRDCTTDHEFFSFIKTAAPNLKDLSFKICIPSESATPLYEEIQREYDLTVWNLNRCSISLEPLSITKRIDCTITVQNVSKGFLLDGKRIALMPTENYVRTSYGVHTIEIKMNVIKYLTIFGFPIVTIGDKILIDL